MLRTECLTRTRAREVVEEIIAGGLSDEIEDATIELPDAFARAHSRIQTKPPTFVIPGFEKLTGLAGGIGRHGFTVITGPTGAGKSTLACNLWVNLIAMGKPVYTVPIEIGAEDFIDIAVSIVAGKSRRNLTVSDYEEAKRKYFPLFFSNRSHVFGSHESRLSHLDFLAEVYYHHINRNVEIAFADNWNFMLEPSAGKDALALNDKALHDCIVFTKKVPVHIFMVMHPRKPDSGAADKVESMYDVKGSSTSIQESQNVWIFNRVDDESLVPPGVEIERCREIKIAKARYNGRAVGARVIYSIARDSELYEEYRIV